MREHTIIVEGIMFSETPKDEVSNKYLGEGF